MMVARLRKAYVAATGPGWMHPWVSGAPKSAKAARHEMPGKMAIGIRPGEYGVIGGLNTPHYINPKRLAYGSGVVLHNRTLPGRIR